MNQLTRVLLLVTGRYLAILGFYQSMIQKTLKTM
jgi:hypothetical protein